MLDDLYPIIPRDKKEKEKEVIEFLLNRSR